MRGGEWYEEEAPGVSKTKNALYGRKTDGVFSNTWVVTIYGQAGWTISYKNHEGKDEPTAPKFVQYPNERMYEHTFDGHIEKNYFDDVLMKRLHSQELIEKLCKHEEQVMKILHKAKLTEGEIFKHGGDLALWWEEKEAWYYGNKSTGKWTAFINDAGFLYFGRFEGYIDMTDTSLHGKNGPWFSLPALCCENQPLQASPEDCVGYQTGQTAPEIDIFRGKYLNMLADKVAEIFTVE